MAIGLAAETELYKQQLQYQFTQPLSPISTIPEDVTSSIDVAKAWWTNETILGDAYSFLRERSEYSGEVGDPTFSPYEFYSTNKEQYADLERYMLDGTFNRVRGPLQFKATANALRRELDNREIIENSEGWDFALGLTTSLLDPSTFIPIAGWGYRGYKGGKILSTALQVGGVVAGEELIHHSQQRARTMYESVMAVGTATVLGGALGGLGTYLQTRPKGSLNSKDNPQNPLHEKNISHDDPGSDMIIPRMGESVSEQMSSTGAGRMSFDAEDGVQLEMFNAAQRGETKAGAETAAPGTPRFNPNATQTIQGTKVARAVDWTQGKLGFTRSPTTVAVHTASERGRNLLTSLAEMGLRTTEMAAGKARAMSVELWKDVSIYAKQQGAEETMVSAYEKLRMQQGAKSAVVNKYRSDLKEAANAIGIKHDQSFLSLADFQYLVQRKLRGGEIEVDDLVNKAVNDAVKGYRKFTDEMYNRAAKVGLLAKGQFIEQYVPQIWNRTAIINDPGRLKDAFKQKFSKRFAGDAKGLDEFVEELVNKLAKGEEPGFHRDGILREGTFSIGKSKRMETRALHIKADELDNFEEFLVKDLSSTMKQYADDMGGRIALTEFFGKYSGKDKTLKSFEELANPMKAVRAEFADLKKGKSGDEYAKIERDEQHVYQAVENLRQRLLNVDRRGDPNGVMSGEGAMFAGRTLRRVNFLRFMGSVMLASLTDMATISLSHGAKKHLGELFKNVGKIAKEAKNMNNRELAFMLYGAEGTMSNSRTAKLVGLDDGMASRGFGMGNTRKVSGAVDAGMDWASNQMNFLNLMHWWNSRHKFITGHVVLGNILDDAARLNRGEKLANRGKRSGNYKWNELGITDDMMRRMDDMVQKHGFDESIEGVSFRWPDTDKWLDEAPELVTALHGALKRSTERAVITPGIADLPMFHSKQMGQILFQFNSFGFAAVNKFTRNLADEAVHGDAMSALMATTWAVTMGTAAYAIREGMIKGRELPDPTDEPATWVYESIDRSGLMMWMMPFSNSAMKLMAPHLNEAGVKITQPSRFAQQKWYESLFGPSVSTVTDAGSAIYHLSDGDMERLNNKAKRLAPYRNVFWMNALWRTGWGEDN